jgi:hypothetical protein
MDEFDKPRLELLAKLAEQLASLQRSVASCAASLMGAPRCKKSSGSNWRH